MMEKQIIIIDVALYCLEERPIPQNHRYLIKVDREKIIANQGVMTGREILTLAGKSPVERFQLNQKLRGGKVEKISFDEPVDFTTPGVEKFMTIPLDQTEG
jgi:hypothetical protein